MIRCMSTLAHTLASMLVDGCIITPATWQCNQFCVILTICYDARHCQGGGSRKTIAVSATCACSICGLSWGTDSV